MGDWRTVGMIGTRISNLLGKITVLIVICFLTLTIQAKYGGGTGEPYDPYLIYDANQMNAIGADANDWDNHFLLCADIDLSGYTGTSFNIIVNFEGIFDGNGHTISNFTYTSPGTRFYIGLFGYVVGEIRDLGLIDPNVDAGTGGYVGSMVGHLISGDPVRGTVTGCYAEGGSVSGEFNYVGGLVGYNSWGTITNCWATGNVTGREGVGGLVGNNYEGTITNCYSKGSVSGDWFVGGLVGKNYEGTITNCYSKGSVSGDWFVGGLVGKNYEGTITNCYATGSVSGTTDVGGLVGYDSSGSYTKSFWDNTVNSGLIGIGNTSDPNVIGESTANMQIQVTFTDATWDFIDVWNIGEHQTYPYLRTVPTSDINKDGITNFLDLCIVANQWMEEE